MLLESVSLLQYKLEQQLRAEGGISYVQFELLARLADADGSLTMTQLADGVVYSRSGLTYQAGLLEKAGLIIRGPDPDDERATAVTLTDDGRALVRRVLPGHIQLAVPPGRAATYTAARPPGAARDPRKPRSTRSTRNTR
ncbi:MarR family winged helix-turn-helix transcriptional regulator [Actinacidiphila sp. bgisy145]|uniref:MarR family winged helix-turn-helix transcriptional regulator n=1 Tax=Actinacidiphila sp. bgisy145 TaxID=3413792 RepID=UPI003EBD1891